MFDASSGTLDLESIAIVSPPNKTNYLPGEDFIRDGMVIKSTYTNGVIGMPTDYTVEPEKKLPEGTNQVTITYTEGDGIDSVTTPIKVERGIAHVPTTSSKFTYNTEKQTPIWNGYDTSKMTISGDTSATDAGSYTASFTPTYQYKWSDGTIDAKDVKWKIDKAQGNIILNSDKVKLDDKHPSATVSFTKIGTGHITATPSNENIKAVISGNNLTVSIVGKKKSGTVELSIADDGNYTEAKDTLTVSCGYSELEYIELTGDQYITIPETFGGHKWNIELDGHVYNKPSYNGHLFGFDDSGSRTVAAIWEHNNGNSFWAPIGHFDSQTVYLTSEVSNSRHIIKGMLNPLTNNSAISADNVVGHYGRGGSVFSGWPSINIPLFANYSKKYIPTLIGKVYSYKILKDDVLVYNLKPGFDPETQKAGLYNDIDDVFYPSESGVEFIKGPEV